MRKALVTCFLLLPLCGCAVAMSASRSTSKGDPAMMQVGADRAIIEESFGAPNMTASLDAGKTKVIYKIDPDAHSAGARNAAVAGHVVADVLTLGLWEVVGTPLELAAQDKYTNYVLIYGPDNKIQTIETIK
ncbi:MAG: hypothetical protein PHD48_09970 [Alphaproteobacteria bacterium]|nr:hypothetical protein [Alphaproteobacteria bacterium]